MPRRLSDRAHLSYKVGGPKVWYSLSATICLPYLQCLLQAEELATMGITHIPHYAKNPKHLYIQLLHGEHVDAADQGLLCIDDEGVEEHAAPAEHDDTENSADDVELCDVLPDADFQPHDSEPNTDFQPHDSEPKADLQPHDSEPKADLQPEDPEPSADLQPLDVELKGPQDPEPAQVHLGEQQAVEDCSPSYNSCRVAFTEKVWSTCKAGPALPEGGPGPLAVGLVETVAKWGAFRFTPKQRSDTRPYGGIEATCPFHKKSEATGCKKYMALRDGTAATRVATIKCLQAWCAAAPLYDRQRQHLHHFLHPVSAPPDQAVLDAGYIADRPAVPVLTDLELDAADEPPADARGRGRGKAAAKGKAKPKAGKGRGRSGRIAAHLLQVLRPTAQAILHHRQARVQLPIHDEANVAVGIAALFHVSNTVRVVAELSVYTSCSSDDVFVACKVLTRCSDA
eukprot:6490377-Amphidinium_carterae.1